MKLDLSFRGLSFSADCIHDRGCHTMRNGDPGWPESFSCDVGTFFLEDPSEFLAYCDDFSEDEAETLSAMKGKELPEWAAKKIPDSWEDDIQEYAWEEYADSLDDGPDYDPCD